MFKRYEQSITNRICNSVAKQKTISYNTDTETLYRNTTICQTLSYFYFYLSTFIIKIIIIIIIIIHNNVNFTLANNPFLLHFSLYLRLTWKWKGAWYRGRKLLRATPPPSTLTRLLKNGTLVESSLGTSS